MTFEIKNIKDLGLDDRKIPCRYCKVPRTPAAVEGETYSIGAMKGVTKKDEVIIFGGID